MRSSVVHFLIICVLTKYSNVQCAKILMITMGGTKSHKIPFLALAKGLIARHHRITFVNGFPPDYYIDGLKEVTPHHLVDYIQNYTNWDLVGARYEGRMPLTLTEAMQYPSQACNSLLSDPATNELLTQNFHLAIVDGAFPECALGVVYRLSVPFMYINTVGFYTGSLSLAGNPIVYAVTPHVFTSLKQAMSFSERMQNFVTHIAADLTHHYYTRQVHGVLKTHFGSTTPHPYTLSRNVSFILHNGHAALSYARPLQPNVAEIGCIHCHRPAKRSLSPDLEEFMSSAPSGVILFSMGSSVRPSNMPRAFCDLLVEVFRRLPQYRVLWKWDNGDGDSGRVGAANASQRLLNVPENVRLSAWLPQQAILGHRKLKLFITHGGLLSMYEAIYHAAPMVMLPVFCDHDVNAAKAESDGYALRLPLEAITAERLHRAINEVIRGAHYRKAVRKRRQLLLDQMSTPLETAVYWTEYVLRHKGAPHLQAAERDMSFIVYHSLDVIVVLAGIPLIMAWGCFKIIAHTKRGRNSFKCKRN